MKSSFPQVLLLSLLVLGLPVTASPEDINRAINLLEQAKESLRRDDEASLKVQRIDDLIRDIKNNTEAIEPTTTCQLTIYRIFREVLGRSPDPVGLANYDGQCMSGVKESTIRRDIAASPESKRNINQSFQKLLCRSAEEQAILTYTSELANGKKIGDIQNTIKNSDEYKNGPPACRR